MSDARKRSAIMVDPGTRDIIAAEGGKYGLTIASVIRILAHKLRAGSVSLL